ncbi:hypothetical protein C8Q73DRAFT_117080 [Cubamyces lactineus]|nr:hypothetical protein C8Q73DRAFT_117080 [Cubamyces lactineus]
MPVPDGVWFQRSRWLFEGFSFWTCVGAACGRMDGQSWTARTRTSNLERCPEGENAAEASERPGSSGSARDTPHHTAVRHPTHQRTIESAIICPARLGCSWSLRQAYLRLDFENRELEGERGGSDSERRGRPPACFDKRRGDGRAWVERRRERTLVTFAPLPIPCPVPLPSLHRGPLPVNALSGRLARAGLISSGFTHFVTQPPSILRSLCRPPPESRPRPAQTIPP